MAVARRLVFAGVGRGPVGRVTLLDDLLDRPDWQQRAACRGLDPDRFYPVETHEAAFADARAVCDGCPVRFECLGFALTEREEFGVWGGSTWPERKRMRQRLGPLSRRVTCGTEAGWAAGCHCGACSAAHAAAIAPPLPNCADRRRVARAKAASR